MIFIGPISSLYDFLTFFVLLTVFPRLGAALPYRMVCRVARDANAGALRHPHGRAIPSAAARVVR